MFSTADAKRAGDPRLRRPKALVIDDEHHNLDIIRRHLRGNFKVLAATSGAEGIALLHEHQDVFLILCDQRMPGASGTEFLAQARVEAPGALRILMTAYADLDTLAEAINLGKVWSYLPKPIEAARLEQLIKGSLKVWAERQTAASSEPEHDDTDAVAIMECLDKRRFGFHVQPIFRTQDLERFGFEALCRPDPRLFAGPEPMIEAALRHGQLSRLGRLLRESAVGLLTHLPTNGVLFINVHPSELSASGLLSFADALGPAAAFVVLEVTESAAVDDYRHARRLLTQLQSRGIRVALDDFGSGYCGINHLARLSPDFVKLDRSLVNEVSAHSRAARLVGHIVDFSHSEGIEVIAEGIETEAELQRLSDLGSDYLQGYHLARPGPVGL